MEKAKERRKKYFIWDSVVDMVCGLITAGFVLGPGVVIGYFLATKWLVMINPSFLGQPAWTRIFAAIMLSGSLTVFFIMMAHWRGE